jgi:hypothetical protein
MRDETFGKTTYDLVSIWQDQLKHRSDVPKGLKDPLVVNGDVDKPTANALKSGGLSQPPAPLCHACTQFHFSAVGTEAVGGRADKLWYQVHEGGEYGKSGSVSKLDSANTPRCEKVCDG